jgi:hypothetical protein
LAEPTGAHRPVHGHQARMSLLQPQDRRCATVRAARARLHRGLAAPRDCGLARPSPIFIPRGSPATWVTTPPLTLPAVVRRGPAMRPMLSVLVMPAASCPGWSHTNTWVPGVADMKRRP